jgi:hypothetical protein
MQKLWSGRLLAATLGACLCAPAAISQPAAATGPWAKVPALTPACYSEGDPFEAKLTAALAAVNASRTRQLAVNKQIEDEHKSIEPMEMATRMQQWMMSNPQEALKYMQGVQAVGDDFNAQMPEMIAAQQRFDAEEKDLLKRQQAALDTASAPSYARHAALKKKLNVPPEYPSVQSESGGTPDWAVAEEHAIWRALDAAYAANCAPWIGATGKVPAWLKTYRAWLTQEFIPFNQRIASQNAQTYAIMNTPKATWKDTAEIDGVIKYLEAVGRVYGNRRAKARCTASVCSYN